MSKSKKDVDIIQREFDKLYNIAIKDINELSIGTKIYGTSFGEATIESSIFMEPNNEDDILWVKVKYNIEPYFDINNKPIKNLFGIICLNPYSINSLGGHNLLFFDKNDYLNYKNHDWIIGYNDIDPIWIKPSKPNRRQLTIEEIKNIPRFSFNIVTCEMYNAYGIKIGA